MLRAGSSLLLGFLLLASGCQYRRDCSAPINHTVNVQEELLGPTRKAIHNWSDRTNGGETIILVKGIRGPPIAGETNMTIEQIDLISRSIPVAGLYYPNKRTIHIQKNFSNDVDVIMHELGHMMGIPHIGKPGTVMHAERIGMEHDSAVCQHICCLPK